MQSDYEALWIWVISHRRLDRQSGIHLRWQHSDSWLRHLRKSSLLKLRLQIQKHSSPWSRKISGTREKNLVRDHSSSWLEVPRRFLWYNFVEWKPLYWRAYLRYDRRSAKTARLFKQNSTTRLLFFLYYPHSLPINEYNSTKRFFQENSYKWCGVGNDLVRCCKQQFSVLWRWWSFACKQSYLL